MMRVCRLPWQYSGWLVALVRLRGRCCGNRANILTGQDGDVAVGPLSVALGVSYGAAIG